VGEKGRKLLCLKYIFPLENYECGSDVQSEKIYAIVSASILESSHVRMFYGSYPIEIAFPNETDFFSLSQEKRKNETIYDSIT
jgi:hypothetical protein